MDDDYEYQIQQSINTLIASNKYYKECIDTLFSEVYFLKQRVAQLEQEQGIVGDTLDIMSSEDVDPRCNLTNIGYDNESSTSR